jgi:streptogramin lyase
MMASAALQGANHKITKLWKSPDGHPNGLESTPEGLWVGEQTTDRACLLDWKTGKVLKKVDTESSNTSGIAYGGGFLWMAANGKAIGRPAKPTDATKGEVIKVDPATGKTVARFPVPDGGGVHGLVYAQDTLWMTCFQWQAICQVDPKDFRVLHKIPVQHGRSHGLAWDPPAMWVLFSNDYVIEKVNVEDGKVLQRIELVKGTDPDPHGMDIYQGKLYYCDAGIAPGGVSNDSPGAGWICRIDMPGS